MSGCDEEAAFSLKKALVAVRSVTVRNVGRHSPAEGLPVGVVGVLDDELTERPEVALDTIEEARIGGSENQLHVAGRGPVIDGIRLVGGEVVHDQVDAPVGVIAFPQPAETAQHHRGVLVALEPALQVV